MDATGTVTESSAAALGTGAAAFMAAVMVVMWWRHSGDVVGVGVASPCACACARARGVTRCQARSSARWPARGSHPVSSGAPWLQGSSGRKSTCALPAAKLRHSPTPFVFPIFITATIVPGRSEGSSGRQPTSRRRARASVDGMRGPSTIAVRRASASLV